MVSKKKTKKFKVKTFPSRPRSLLLRKPRKKRISFKRGVVVKKLAPYKPPRSKLRSISQNIPNLRPTPLFGDTTKAIFSPTRHPYPANFIPTPLKILKGPTKANLNNLTSPVPKAEPPPPPAGISPGETTVSALNKNHSPYVTFSSQFPNLSVTTPNVGAKKGTFIPKQTEKKKVQVKGPFSRLASFIGLPGRVPVDQPGVDEEEEPGMSSVPTPTGRKGKEEVGEGRGGAGFRCIRV